MASVNILDWLRLFATYTCVYLETHPFEAPSMVSYMGQGSKLSPYLFNIFINQLLLDLNDCDVGVRIGDVLYNSMAYADDITVFSTNAKDLQRLIDMCTMYSDRWRFKYGIDKSKCMIIGKSPFTCEPVWRLNDVSLRTVDTI